MTKREETGAIRKRSGATIPVALVYPNTYRVGMGNLGFQFLYHYLNTHPRFSAERFFFPDFSPRGKAAAKGPVSEESGHGLRNFPVVAFSIPFENDYPAVPGILLAAGIPPLQRDRGPDDPLVIAGGVSVSMNPEPLADFLDMVLIGELDDDPASGGFFERLGDALERPSGALRDRKGFISRFADVPGVYVPSAYKFEYDGEGMIREIRADPGFPTTVRAVKRLARNAAVPVSVLFSPEAEFGDTLLVEANRGCGNACRFCAAGWIHFPVRHVRMERFRIQLEAAVAEGRTIGLVGSDLAGHPELEEILQTITDLGGAFSLSSIRPEGLSPTVIRLMARTGQKTATLAPEVASPGLKRVIGKEIPSERFFELIPRLVAGGIPNLRFYFMVGLPTETDDDAGEIVDFVMTCREIFLAASRPLGKIGRIGVQLNPFVPKPWTPFQWAAMAQPRVIEQRLKIVRNRLRREPNLVVRAESAQHALEQAVLSRGDRKVAEAVLAAARQGGRWSGVFRSTKIDPAFYALRERSLSELLPWDVVDHGIRKATLRGIYMNSLGKP